MFSFLLVVTENLYFKNKRFTNHNTMYVIASWTIPGHTWLLKRLKISKMVSCFFFHPLWIQRFESWWEFPSWPHLTQPDMGPGWCWCQGKLEELGESAGSWVGWGAIYVKRWSQGWVFLAWEIYVKFTEVLPNHSFDSIFVDVCFFLYGENPGPNFRQHFCCPLEIGCQLFLGLNA